jgi:hypothetical protein
MSSLMIRDLAHTEELDSKAMSGVRGGLASVPPLPFANVNVNVDIDQTIAQFQQIEVNAFNNNNIGVIGADFGFKLDLKAAQIANAGLST